MLLDCVSSVETEINLYSEGMKKTVTLTDIFCKGAMTYSKQNWVAILSALKYAVAK